MGSIILMDVLPDVCFCLLRKKNAPLLPEGTAKFTHLPAQHIHRGR